LIVPIDQCSSVRQKMAVQNTPTYQIQLLIHVALR
jgi:hypothetical protein